MRSPLAGRFWPKVRKGPGCWIWTGATVRAHARDPEGDRYGSFWTGPGKHDTSLAHRVAYELARGPIAPGMTLDHLCCTTLCVRPAHLEPVTREENLRREAMPRGERPKPPRRGRFRIALAPGKTFDDLVAGILLAKPRPRGPQGPAGGPCPAPEVNRPGIDG